MTGGEVGGDHGERHVSREQLAALLFRLGIRGQDANAVLGELQLPATVDEVLQRLAPRGISRDAVLNSLGSSP